MSIFKRIFGRWAALHEWNKMQAEHKARLNRIIKKHGKRSVADERHKQRVTAILQGRR